jgi:hypothetical protein
LPKLKRFEVRRLILYQLVRENSRFQWTIRAPLLYHEAQSVQLRLQSPTRLLLHPRPPLHPLVRLVLPVLSESSS